jgi:hypothetical protein
MFKRLHRLTSAGLALLLLAGLIALSFTTVQDANAQSATSRVRVAHLSPDTPNVDVYANGAKVLSNVPFKAVSDYLTVPAGSNKFDVRVAGAEPTSRPALSATVNLLPNRDYTVGAANFLAHIEAILLEDDNRLPVVGFAKLKVVHASPDAPKVDIAVKDVRDLIRNLAFTEESKYVTLRAGTYDLEVQLSPGNNTFLPLPGVTLEPGKVYTVFAVDRASKLSVVVNAVDGKLDAGETSRVRVAHLSPDAPNVDVYANGLKVLSNVPFKTVSGYLEVTSGRYRFEVRPAGAPATSKAVIDVTTRLGEGLEYTIAATGFLANIRGQIFKDDNSAPPAGKIKLLVVHASPDAPRVDVAITNGPVLIRNLRFGQESDELRPAAGTYNLEVRVAGTKQVALALPNVTFEAGKIYTVFAVDRVANLSVVVAAEQGRAGH